MDDDTSDHGRPGASGARPDVTGGAPVSGDHPSETGAVTVGARRLSLLVAGLAVVVLVVDQVTKALALVHLDEHTSVPVLGEWLQLRLLFNSGAAFSLASGMTWVLTALAVVVVGLVIRMSRRLGSRGWAVALGLLLGGAVGNLVDRLVRPPGFARGHVVDFIAYGDWFVGNVADVAIVVAAGMIMLQSLRGVGLDGLREGSGRQAQEASGG